MKRLSFTLIIINFFLFQTMNAQIFTSVIDETALQFKVKQVDEFFDRFNYVIDYKGDAPIDVADREARRKNFLTLLNLDKFSKNNKNLDSIANEFVNYIIENDVKIHYEDSSWCAEAKGTLVFEGKKYDVTLYLKTEQIRDVMYKWVVSEIESPLFNQFSKKTEGSITISPAEHGIGFMTVPETFNLNNYVVGTTFVKGYQRNNLTVFDFLMTTGKIKMSHITKVVYHFNLSEFDFDVERIERTEGYNQGWLINNIKKHI